MAGVKAENDTRMKIDSGKAEQDDHGGSLNGAVDEDIYEDAGDLDFADASQDLYLARVPNWLWKAWADLDGDQEIQIGTVRVEGDDPSRPKRMSLRLENTETQRHLPKEFNMNISNDNSANTFVFTEKDFPGYNSRSRGKARFSADESARPFSQAEPRFQQERQKANDSNNKVDKGKRTSYYRKAIPKKTAVSGSVRMEMNCLPVQNKEYYDYLNLRRKAEEVDRGPIMLEGHIGQYGGNVLSSGALGDASNFESFTKAAAPARPKGQDFKAARIPQNELLDLLFDCFKQYRYWPMKFLKQELNQPEAYLRQTLEMIAELVKSGPFAGRWRLRQGANFAEYGVDTQSLATAEEGERQKGFGADGASDVGDDDDDDDEDTSMKKE